MVCKHYIALARVRITAMVLASTAVGYVLASAGAIRWSGLWLVVLGTGLAAVGAGTVNQILEKDRDAKMARTCRRPLPAGLISPGHALVFAVATIAAGLAVLNEAVNPLTALLGTLNVLIYTLIYTPLKTRTPAATLIGAICGALPPLMGWTAADNALSLGAMLLAAILFVWQVPHFLALVWIYRDQYTAAGYRLLPVIDPSGRLTCLAIVLYSLAMMPLGLAVTCCGIAGYLFGAASLVLGLGLFLPTVKLCGQRTPENARRVFLASVIYLPLLLGVMVADARPAPAGSALRGERPPSATETTSTPERHRGRSRQSRRLRAQRGVYVLHGWRLAGDDRRAIGPSVGKDSADEDGHKRHAGQKHDENERPVVAEVHEVEQHQRGLDAGDAQGHIEI
jgi:heme o synthase